MDKIEVCDNLEQDGGELRSQFWWRWKASNGRILATSETYPKRATAVRMARRAYHSVKYGGAVNMFDLTKKGGK